MTSLPSPILNISHSNCSQRCLRSSESPGIFLYINTMTSACYFHPCPHSCSMECARGCTPWDDVMAAAKGQWICVLGFLCFKKFFTVFNKNPIYWQYNKMLVGGPYKQNFLTVFNASKNIKGTCRQGCSVVRVLSAQPDNLRSVSGTYVVAREKFLL